MNKLLEKLRLGDAGPVFDECYEKALKDDSLPECLSEEYILRLHEECNVLPTHLSLVLKAREGVVANEDLTLFVKTICNVLESGPNSRAAMCRIRIPTAPEGADPLPYDMVGVFPILSTIRKSREALRKRGIPEDIIEESFPLDGTIGASSERDGRDTFNNVYFNWCFHYVYGTILRIGRFNFEIFDRLGAYGACAFENSRGDVRVLMSGVPFHKDGARLGAYGHKDEEGSFTPELTETEDYYEGYEPDGEDTGFISKDKVRLDKKEWTLFVSPKDTCLSVHIPADGAFDKESCEASYDRAREVFSRCYPEYDFKAFICISWLLSEDLRQILKPDSKILSFSDKYVHFPNAYTGCSCFSFAFKKIVTSLDSLDVDSLPEETSLQRGVKQRYKDGGIVREGSGIFKF